LTHSRLLLEWLMVLKAWRLTAVALPLIMVGCTGTAPSSEQVQATYDKQSGKLSQLTINPAKDGKPNLFSYMDGTKFVRIEIDNNEDGKIDRWEHYGTDQKITKVGFSRANDGQADSWAFQAADGSLARIEVSTRRDGKANRTEFYGKGVLVRAEEDTNQDGAVDKWETYAENALATVGFDTKGSGTPNYVIDYRKEGRPK
jgi:hypothetical protein